MSINSSKYHASKVWACHSCAYETPKKPERGSDRICSYCRKGRIECFDSKKEYLRFTKLLLLQKAGAIRNLTTHPIFKIVVEGKDIGLSYEADFQYFEGDKNVVEDVKGFHTDVFKIKRKLVEALYPGLKIRIVK